MTSRCKWTRYVDESLGSNMLEKRAFRWHPMSKMNFFVDVKVDCCGQIKDGTLLLICPGWEIKQLQQASHVSTPKPGYCGNRQCAPRGSVGAGGGGEEVQVRLSLPRPGPARPPGSLLSGSCSGGPPPAY